MKIVYAAAIIIQLFLLTSPLGADNRITFRISVENTETHVQTMAVRRFADLLSREFNDKFDVQFYHSAQLFRDSEVVRAITRGDLEMAVPGTWQLDKYVPEIGYLLMPDFFGADSSDIDAFINRRGGTEIISRIEKYLDVKVPGLWMDLGSAHIFTASERISDFSDFENLRIRVAGGIANKKRVEIFGAEGVIIPWPDLQQRITDGSIDGLLTSFETVRSAELWNLGISYVFTDSEYFACYIPVVSAYFWNQLTIEEQITFSEIWNEVAIQQRAEAAKAQRDAMKISRSNGITITVPSPAQMNKARSMLKEHESEILVELHIEPDVLMLLREE